MDTAPAESPAADTFVPETPAPDATKASKLANLPRLVRARAAALHARAKDLQARAKDLPIEARTRALALIARVRAALDLPSRSEIAELTARLDQLDRRITEIAAAHGIETSKPVPGLAAGLDLDAVARASTLPDGTPDPIPHETTEARSDAELPEHQRKDKKRNHAAKTTRR